MHVAESLVIMEAGAGSVRLEPKNRTEEPRTELVGSGFFLPLVRFQFLRNRNLKRTEEPNRTEPKNRMPRPTFDKRAR